MSAVEVKDVANNKHHHHHHWPHFHDISFESCENYGNQNQCMIVNKDNQFNFKKPGSCCNHCSKTLLLPTINLSIEPITTDSEFGDKFTKIIMMTSIFTPQNINNFSHFLKRRKYLKNFIKSIDSCIEFCDNISTLNQIGYRNFMQHQTNGMTDPGIIKTMTNSFMIYYINTNSRVIH